MNNKQEQQEEIDSSTQQKQPKYDSRLDEAMKEQELSGQPSQDLWRCVGEFFHWYYIENNMSNKIYLEIGFNEQERDIPLANVVKIILDIEKSLKSSVRERTVLYKFDLQKYNARELQDVITELHSRFHFVDVCIFRPNNVFLIIRK